MNEDFKELLQKTPSSSNDKAESSLNFKPSGRLNGAHILIVDDSSDNRLLISHLLKREGAQVLEASNGEEGVAQALEQAFDVVLMDIQMPILDGHSAVQKLRAASYKRPILALTAHVMNDEIKKALSSGFDGYLTKPLDLKTLVEKIENCLKP